MQLYYSKKFSESEDTFREVLSLNPDDDIARMFLTKIELLIKTEIPDAWDGIEVMDFK
jgi:hypothetical protein